MLGDVALGDADAELRLNALAKITQRSTLERVAKGARRRDKHIYNRAREVLDALEAAECRPMELRQQADKLCLQVEALVKAARHNTNWEAMDAAAAQASQQWRELVTELPSVLGEDAELFVTRYSQARDKVEQDLASWREGQEAAREAAAAQGQRLAAASALCAALESELTKIMQAGTVDDMAALETLLAKSEQDWRALGDVPSDSNTRYQRAVTALRAAAADTRVLSEVLPQLDTLLDKVQRLLAGDSLFENALQRVEKSWAAMIRPSQLQLDVAKTTQIEEGLAALRERLAEEQRRRQAQVEKFTAQIKQLEDYLRDDTYKPAFELAQQTQQTFDAMPESARHSLLKKSLLRRWQQVQTQLQEMRDWRQWANAPVMERLCGDMERLADQAEQHANDDVFDFADCAARVRSAREEWKQLTSARSGAPKALWQRFDAACTRAYAPCEARFGEEHQQRETHLAAKEAICQGLEDYSARVASQPLDQVDWHALEQIIQTADTEWKAVGPVPRAALSACNKRFRKVMERLRAQMNGHYQRNRDAKEELIQRATGLLKSAQEARMPVTEVAEKTKALQSEWKGVGRAAKEGELWRRFRTECDAVFTLRDAEKTARREALSADVAVYQALSEQLDAAVEKAGEEPGQARQEMEQLQAQWREAPRLPKREAEKWERRFHAAMERFDNRIRAERKNAQQQARQRLRDKAALCVTLERLVESVIHGEISPDAIAPSQADVVAQWDALGVINGPLAKGIEQRYAEALAWLERLHAVTPAALRQEFESLRQSNLERRLDLCLQMEILAGVESPPEYREARLRSQVENLAMHMKSGEQRDAVARAAELEAAWYATAALPSAQAAALEQRFAGASRLQ